MADFDRILSVKNAVEAKLRKYPGVHAVGIGHKITAGKKTGEMSIAVFVTRKRALSDLQPHEVVPTEIDGIKTDVIEQEIPHLLMAGDPTELTFDIANPARLVLTFSGSVSAGLLVVVEVFVTPPGGSGSAQLVSTQTYGWYDLTTVASDIAQKITSLGYSWLTATASGAQVTLAPTGGGAAAFTRCNVTAVDDDKYFKDFLRGGIQIQAGGPAGLGTLGWMAKSDDGTAQGKILGVTNHHVATLWTGTPTNLKAVYDSTTVSITFSRVSDTAHPPAFLNTDPIPPETIVIIQFRIDRTTDFNAVYSTAVGDTEATVATNVMNIITALGTQGSATVSASPGSSASNIQLSVTGVTELGTFVLDPPVIDRDSDLKVQVVRDPALATRHTFTFTGSVAGDDYGIYVNIDLGGMANTFGVFLNPDKNRDLTALASDVAQAINNVNPTTRGAASASPTGAAVQVDGAALLECLITHDIRVGQPTNDFTCPCSHCCNNRIGRVVAVDLPSDTVLIALDSDFKYLAAVEGDQESSPLELVAGPYTVQSGDLGPTAPGTYPVHKRGRTTHRTDGTIQYLNVSGDIGEFNAPAPSSRVFHRHYKNAMSIQSGNSDPFSDGGDSGSAILNNNHEVVGILFGGGNLAALATPIDQIVAAYPSFNLTVAVPIPADNSTPVPVPATAQAMAQERRIFQGLAPTATLEKRLSLAEEEISATPEGREYSTAVRRHVREAVRLVNHNRRVAAVWHRNGGPQIVGGVLRMVQHRDRPLPTRVNGKPLAECLARIQSIFTRYGSEAFAADLQRYGPRFVELLGQTYNQTLSELQPATSRAGGEHGG